MPGNLKKFEAVLAEWTGPEFRIVTISFDIEDEDDALEIAEDIALLEGTDLIALSKCRGTEKSRR